MLELELEQLAKSVDVGLTTTVELAMNKVCVSVETQPVACVNVTSLEQTKEREKGILEHVLPSGRVSTTTVVLVIVVVEIEVSYRVRIGVGRHESMRLRLGYRVRLAGKVPSGLRRWFWSI